VKRRLALLAAVTLAFAALSLPAARAAGESSSELPWEAPGEGSALGEARESACGYSSGGVEYAAMDAEHKAQQACLDRGCTGADIQVGYMPWQEGGYTHVCMGYVCTGC
jgi:hypothetical protein